MKPPIEMMLDGVEWKPFESAPTGELNLPYVTHQGELEIDTLKLTVYQLSDGQRIIPEDQMIVFFQWLGVETGDTP